MKTLEISEEERQMILMALARLAVERRGFNWFIDKIADKLEGRRMFEHFKRLKRGESTVNLSQIPVARGAVATKVKK